MAKVAPTLIRRNTDQSAMSKALSQGEGAAAGPVTSGVPARLANAVGPEGYIVGQVYRVPLNMIKMSKYNARQLYLPSEIDEMSASLQDKGQDVPAVGYVNAGKVVVVDGQKRYKAATSASLPDLMVLIVEAPDDPRQEYEESRRINLTRSSQSVLDDALRWTELIQEGIYPTQIELGTALGMDQDRVSKILGIARIPEKLLRKMQEHPQTQAWSIAYEISKIYSAGKFDDPELVADEVIEQVQKKDMNKSQVIALIASKIEGPKTRERAKSEKVKFSDKEGELKVFPSRGQLDLSFRGLAPEKVDELKTLIVKALGGQLTL